MAHSRQHTLDSATEHSVSGLTIGHVLRAASATTFAFAAIGASDLPIPLALTPSGTGTQTIFSITPSAALAAGAYWDGIKLDLAALDPSGAGAVIHAIHVDLSGVNLTNDPELNALHLEGPATFTGQSAKKMFHADAYGLHADLIEGDSNHAAHFTGPVHLDMDATGIGATEIVTGLIVEVDATGVTQGDIHALHINGIVGSGEQVAIGTNSGWGIIHQHTGIYAASQKVWKRSGAAWTDATTAFGSAGTDVEIFSADNDWIYISGTSDALKFDSVEVILATVASLGVKPKYEYWNGSVWTSFIPIDGASQFTINGVITWDSTGLASWTQSDENSEGTSRYWIRIQRQRNNVSTPPIEDTIKVLKAVQYGWDKSGDLTIHALTVAADSLMSGTAKWQFGDSGTYIYQSANSVLGYVADGRHEFTGGPVYVGSGSPGHGVDASGELFVAGVAEFNGVVYFDSSHIILTYGTQLQFDSGYSGIFRALRDDGLHLALYGDSENFGNRNFILVDAGARNDDYDHSSISADPHLFIHSTTRAASETDEWWSIAFPVTHALYSVGSGWHEFAGDILSPSSAKHYFDAGASQGTEYIWSEADGRIKVEAGTSIDLNADVTLAGTIDGVDLDAFKTAYDSHAHGGIYYTETEVDTWRSNVNSTEMSYLDGVTSDIQDQIDGLGAGVDSYIYVYVTDGFSLAAINTWYDVVWDVAAAVKENVTHNHAGGSPEEITLTEAGAYEISWMLNHKDAGGTHLIARVLDDGTEIEGSHRQSRPYSGEKQPNMGCVLVKAGANSVIKLQVGTNSVSGINEIEYLDPASLPNPTTFVSASMSIVKIG